MGNSSRHWALRTSLELSRRFLRIWNRLRCSLASNGGGKDWADSSEPSSDDGNAMTLLASLVLPGHKQAPVFSRRRNETKSGWEKPLPLTCFKLLIFVFMLAAWKLTRSSQPPLPSMASIRQGCVTTRVLQYWDPAGAVPAGLAGKIEFTLAARGGSVPLKPQGACSHDRTLSLTHIRRNPG